MTAETIKLYVRAVINRVPRLAAEVIGNEWPQHSHSIHSDLDADDHLHYMLCAGGAARPFTGDVYWSEDTALWGAVELRFGDHFFDLYQAAYPDNWPEHGIALAKSQAEVSDFRGRYGVSSILGALSTAYDLGGGGSGTFSYLARDGGTHWTDYGILYPGTGIALADGAHGVSIALSHLGIQSLTDPGADRILFWDDSSNAAAWLTLGTNLSITGTTLNAAGYTGGSFNHDDLLNRGNDGAHNQYILVSGTRAFTGNQSMGGHDLTNIGVLSGQTTLEFLDPYITASSWSGNMPLSSSQDEVDDLLALAGGEVSAFGAWNLGITAITDDNGVTQVKGAPLAIYAGNSILISKIQSQTGFVNGFRFDYNPEGAHIAPSSINTAVGTPTGSLSGILTINDGSVYHVDETTGAPGMIVNIGWADITTFNRIVLRLWYHGTAPLHDISIQLQNFAVPGYDEFENISLSAGYQVLSFEVPNPSDYINSGAVTLRLYHDDNGSTSHDLDIDYASMIVGTGGGVVSMQGAYDGGKTITMSSGNAGPVVINSGTEASPCLSLVQTQAAFSSYVAQISNADESDVSKSLLFSGAAGGGSSQDKYGHRIWTDGSLSIGSTYETNGLESSFRLYRHATSAGLHQRARLGAHVGDGLTHSAYFEAQAYNDTGTGANLNGVATGNISLTATNGMLLDGGSYIRASNCQNITFGSDFVSASRSSTVITADFDEGQYQEITTGANNITEVELLFPSGVCTCELRVTNNDTAAHTITNFTDGTTQCVTWKGDIDPDAGALSIPAGTTTTFHFSYHAGNSDYEGYVSPDA